MNNNLFLIFIVCGLTQPMHAFQMSAPDIYARIEKAKKLAKSIVVQYGTELEQKANEEEYKLQDEKGQELLSAAKKSDIATVDLLLSNPIDVDVQDSHGRTPLMWAILRNNLDLFKRLTFRTNTEIQNKNGFTAIMQLTALSETDERLTMLQILLGLELHVQCTGTVHKALLQAESHNNKVTATMIRDASQEMLGIGIESNDLKRVKSAIAAGADVNKKEFITSGETPIFKLLDYHKGRDVDIDEVLTALIKAGAAINEKDSSGYTPLMKAVRTGNLSALVTLLDEGADINILSRGLSAEDMVDEYQQGNTEYKVSVKSYFANYRNKLDADAAALISQEIFENFTNTRAPYFPTIVKDYLQPSEEDKKKVEDDIIEEEQGVLDLSLPTFKRKKQKECIIS